MRPGKERDWRDPAASPAWRLGNLLDLRDADSHAAAHPVGAVNMPLPPDAFADPEAVAANLADALPAVLLPPRHEPLLVMGETEVAEAVAEFLRGRGRPAVTALTLDAGAVAALPGELREIGIGRRRLWGPPEFLAGNEDLLPAPDLGPAVDLGAGCGRAAAWLSERGWRVTAVDRHRRALDLAARVAESAGVEFETACADLTDPSQVPSGPWALILAFRFLDRDLMDRMGDLLLPGGVAVIRTYRWIEDCGGKLPAERHCLHPGELLDFFPADRFETLVHVEDDDPDGSPAAGIVARRL